MTDTDVRRIEDKVDGVTIALARLEGSLSPTLQRLTESQDDLERRQEARNLEVDHRFEKAEERLTSLERFRYSVPSLAGLALLCAVVEGIYYALHLH